MRLGQPWRVAWRDGSLALLCVLMVSACAARVAPMGDGRAPVSYDQFAGAVDSKAFVRLDRDQSATLDSEEWRQLDRTFEASQDFERLDTDRDHEISPYEWQTNLGGSGVVLHLFRYLDVNRDDYVSSDELHKNAVAAGIVAITF